MLRTQRRTATHRRYLMCPPTYFDVCYSINPWMDPDSPTDGGRAMAQWEQLRSCLRDIGHTVELIDPLPGLPDMVFAANGATVVDGRVLSARFRYPERAAEAAAYAEWLRANGFPDVQDAVAVNEGEGDYLVAGRWILAGTGFRSDLASHQELRRIFDRPVVDLTLTDPHFYHLDTALAVLDDDNIMYYPEAFSPQSRNVLREMFPDAVLAGTADAYAFGLNAVSDNRHVVLSASATGLADQLADRGYVPIGVDVSELRTAGGGAKCCVLELRDRCVPRARRMRPVESHEVGL